MDYVWYSIAGVSGFIAGYFMHSLFETIEVSEDNPKKLFSNGSYVIIIDHPIRNKKMSIFNLLISSRRISYNIDNDLAIKLCKELTKLDDKRSINIILNTTGGELSAIEMICKALRKHSGKITVYIPNYCFSAGTYIVLLADQIYLGKNAYIGPTDPQLNLSLLGTYPATSVIQAIKDTSSDNEILHNFLERFAYNLANKAMIRCDKLIEHVMIRNYDLKTIDKVKKTLNSGLYQHNQTFSFEELKELGLKINDGVPEKINDFISLHLNKKY